MIPIDVVEHWLAEKHCTLWADFDIDDAKGRRAAAEWFRHEVDSLEHFWIVPFIEEARGPRNLPPPREEDRHWHVDYLGMNLFWNRDDLR